MNDTLHACADSPWPESLNVTHSEYESGFLLPQLMGALASESAELGSRNLRQGRGITASFWSEVFRWAGR
ncbi:UNVERIFIED_ORG: hypothetical protein J2Y77_002488 [Pseudomonas lini]|uniref:Uncharacterized protein n=1 Tax=Pseudomonas viciae TaxID=2505979 RepID=A0A4P7PHS4_9PSED|nr:hypothetical protein [Pseudomonas viciae]QBZ90280.1 hypothetical protein EPZ47_16685 [Pseudomonas viciae]UZE84330.1 hypothetical protein LOY66_17105 [Pseudomonas viciae]WGO91245.1 hypothetical protein QCD61_16095 [Pseudomonas viciae]